MHTPQQTQTQPDTQAQLYGQNQQDEDHLRLLVVFHVVVGGLAAVVSLFPSIHVALGLWFLLDPSAFSEGGEAPPAFIGWLFIVIGSLFILAGMVFAALVLLAGRFLSRRRRYMYCLVVAGVECLFMPLGTALGIFTILVLLRPSVKALFAPPPGAAGG